MCAVLVFKRFHDKPIRPWTIWFMVFKIYLGCFKISFFNGDVTRIRFSS